jgi:uncharacterized membrane protein
MPAISTTQRNIKAICAVEKAALANRSFSARIGDTIGSQAGKMWFILCHFLWFTIWIGVNLMGTGKLRFDPYPFALLTMVVSLEAIFLSLFILMSQNRTGLQADQRNHLDLQINLLSEEENTRMLQMLQALCAYHKLPIGNDPEIIALAQRTEVQDVLAELRDNLPE